MDEKQRAKCARFMSRVLTLILPDHEHYDASHASIVYFGVLALTLMDAAPPADRVLQYITSVATHRGFKMSPSYRDADTHLTATYFCLALRRMIGREHELAVDPSQILAFVAACQPPEGACAAAPGSADRSVRHTYSAFAVAHLIGRPDAAADSPWSRHAVQYLLECQNYDGGFGDRPGDESHAGLTFCAVASLRMAGALDRANVGAAQCYLMKRQTSLGGHNGRPNKDTDVCYSFWCLCALDVLNTTVSPESAVATRAYLLGPGFDDLLGGFVKVPGETPDPYHTALALGALACLDGKFNTVLSVPK